MAWFLIPYSLVDEEDFGHSLAAAVKADNKDEAIETFVREGVGDGYLSSDKIWLNPPDWFDYSVERDGGNVFYITGLDFEGYGPLEEEGGEGPETQTRLLTAHYDAIQRYPSWKALEDDIKHDRNVRVADVLEET